MSWSLLGIDNQPKITTLTWMDIEYAVKNILYPAIITDADENGMYEYIYGVPRGGLIPAVMLSHLLDIPVLDHLRFEDHLKHILIVDDIADSGSTMLTYSENFDTACIHWKPTECCTNVDYYAYTVSSGEWIVYPWERGTRDRISTVKGPEKVIENS